MSVIKRASDGHQEPGQEKIISGEVAGLSIQENIAATLKAVMDKKNMTLEEAAQKFGVAKSSLQSYLKKSGNPRSDTLQILSENTGVCLAEMVSGQKILNRGEGGTEIHPILQPVTRELEYLSERLYDLGIDGENGKKTRQ